MPNPTVRAAATGLPLSAFINDPFVSSAFTRAEHGQVEISPLLAPGTRIICIDNFTPGSSRESGPFTDKPLLDAIYTVRDFYRSPDFGVILVRLNEIVRPRADGIEEIGFRRWRFRVLASQPKKAERRRSSPGRRRACAVIASQQAETADA